MKPIGHNTVCVQKLTNSRQNGFEVVGFGVTTDEQIEREIDILLKLEVVIDYFKIDLYLVHILLILVGVQANAVCTRVSGKLTQ